MRPVSEEKRKELDDIFVRGLKTLKKHRKELEGHKCSDHDDHDHSLSSYDQSEVSINKLKLRD